jgi:hypothetical protein
MDEQAMSYARAELLNAEEIDEVFMTAINKQPARYEIEELLPWYATGRLNRRNAERVEQALAGDRKLAQRYESVRRELAETTRLNEALGAPSARDREAIRSDQRGGGANAAPSADQWNAISAVPARQRS